MSIASFMGSKISITTNAELRYEGLLFDLNTNDATIVLQNVRCMGTEGRGNNGEIPPSNNVLDYIVFKGEEIKDIAVCEVQKDKVPSVSQLNYGGMHGPFKSNHMEPMPDRGIGMPTLGNTGMLKPGVPGPMGMRGIHNAPFVNMMNNQMVASPYSQDVQSFFRGGQTQAIDLHMNRMMGPQTMKQKPTNDVFNMFMDNTKPQQLGAETDTANFKLEEFDFGPDPFSETQALGQEARKPAVSFYDKQKEDEFKDSYKDLKDRQIQHNRGMEIGFSKPQKTPQSVDDQTAKTSKAKGVTSQAKPEPPQTGSVSQKAQNNSNEGHVLQPFYDKKSSFFDNLSQEGKENRRSQREERMKQREINMDTFGEDSVRRNYHQQRGARRGRGDRRRYSGRGHDKWNETMPAKRNTGGEQTQV